MLLAPEIPPNLKILTKEEEKIKVIDETADEFWDDLAKLYNENHNQSVNVSKREVALLSTVTLVAYTVGGVGALTLLPLAKQAAKGNAFNEFLYQFSSEFFNLILGGYFFNLVVQEGIDGLIPHLSKDAQIALTRLMKQDTSTKAKLIRWAKTAFKFFPLMAVAWGSSYPSFYLDQHNINHHDRILALTALLALMAMQYKGLESALSVLLSIITQPFKALYRKMNDSAMRNYRITQNCEALKFASQDVWRLVRSEYLKKLQTNDITELNEIYDLSNSKNPTDADTKMLVFKLLTIANKNEFRPHPVPRAIVQLLSQIPILASTIGFFQPTIDSVVEFGNLESKGAIYFWGISVFLIGSVLLSVVLSVELVGNLYDLFAYAANGIRNSWRNSKSWKDFLLNAWANKFDMASWEKLVQFSLPFQQNPIIMNILLLAVVVLSYFSTFVTTFLNEQNLSPGLAKGIELMTIIAVMLVNDYPIPLVQGAAQQFLTRLSRNQQKKQEIKLTEFLKNQENYASQIDALGLVSGLNSFFKDEASTAYGYPEQTIQALMGGKTVEEILGPEYAKKTFTEVIPQLQKEVEIMQNTPTWYARMFKSCKGKLSDYVTSKTQSWAGSAASFFSHPKETSPLLANQPNPRYSTYSIQSNTPNN